jgi:hypothetical protein
MPIPAETPTLASALTLLAVVGQGFLAHRKGQEGKRASARTTKSIDELKLGLSELKVTMIGIDGENGIRGELRELKDEVRGILDRERDRTSIARLPGGDRVAGEKRR